MSTVLRRADLQFDATIDGSSVLVDARRGIATKASPTALIVMQRFAQPRTVAEVVDELVAEGAGPKLEIEPQVANFVEHARSRDMLQTLDPPLEMVPWDPFSHAISGLVDREGNWASCPARSLARQVVGLYQFFETNVSCWADDPEVVAVLRRLPDAQKVSGAAQAMAEIRCGEDLDGPTWEVFLNDRAVGRFHAPSRAVGHLLSYLSNAAVRAADRVGMVHAGCVVFDGQLILIPGSSGCGKSTLVAALAEAGAEVLSDEATRLDASGNVSALFRPITTRRLADPGFPPQPDWMPDAWGWTEEPVVVQRANSWPEQFGLIILPEVAPDAIGYEPVDAFEAFQGLIAASLAGATATQEHVDRLARLASVAPAVRLRTGALNETVSTVRSAIRSVQLRG